MRVDYMQAPDHPPVKVRVKVRHNVVVTACALALLVGLLVAGVVVAGSASASVTSGNRGHVNVRLTPYGGCKEALGYPHSAGARECRHRGWLVGERYVVSPRGRATTTLPRCAEEDSSAVACYWNARTRGNHKGSGFLALAGRSVYVDVINGRRASTTRPLGQWVIVPVTR